MDKLKTGALSTIFLIIFATSTGSHAADPASIESLRQELSLLHHINERSLQQMEWLIDAVVYIFSVLLTLNILVGWYFFHRENKRLHEKINDLSTTHDARFKKIEDQFDTRVKEITKEFHGTLKTLEKDIKGIKEELNDSIKNSVSAVQKRVAELEIAKHVDQADGFIKKNEFINAQLALSLCLVFEHEADSDASKIRIVRALIRLLKAMKENDELLNDHFADLMKTFLTRIEESDSVAEYLGELNQLRSEMT